MDAITQWTADADDNIREHFVPLLVDFMLDTRRTNTIAERMRSRPPKARVEAARYWRSLSPAERVELVLRELERITLETES